MKRVYFVRHGETQGNVDSIDHGPHMELTETGKLQALKVAERSKSLNIQLLVTSDLIRAQQTAEAIRSVNNCALEVSELFREYSVPVSLRGKPYHKPSPEFDVYLKERRENFDNADWHFDNCEENIVELKIRIKTAKALLESKEYESIMVVTHSFFLRFFTACLLFGEDITADNWDRAGRTLVATNTGITMFGIEDEKWSLLTWNDHAHFAE